MAELPSASTHISESFEPVPFNDDDLLAHHSYLLVEPIYQVKLLSALRSGIYASFDVFIYYGSSSVQETPPLFIHSW